MCSMLRPSSALNISPTMWPMEPPPPEPKGTGLPCALIHATKLGQSVAGTELATKNALGTEPM